MPPHPRDVSEGDLLELHNCYKCLELFIYVESRGKRSWLYKCQSCEEEIYVYECWNCDRMYSSQQSDYDRSSQSRYCPHCGKSLGDRQ